ncbi:hypothetical protein NC651_003401 [Populus alba x Populus x berolinensis]|nr:hypothetical protein NC651_003401 [Populus alba x Populus x berolinensis]
MNEHLNHLIPRDGVLLTLFFMVQALFSLRGTCCGSLEFGVKSGFFSEYSKIKYVRFCDPKEGSFGSSLALASTLGQQEIGYGFHRAIPSLDDRSSLKHERDNIDNDLEKNREAKVREKLGKNRIERLMLLRSLGAYISRKPWMI